MQKTLDLTQFTQDLAEDRAQHWLHGAQLAMDSVRNITEKTWVLASALSEMLWAGGDKRLHAFWQTHLKGVLTLKVAKRLVRLWKAFKDHPDREMLGPIVWGFVNHDIDDKELSEAEEMAKAGASPDELRNKLAALGQAAEDRRANSPYNEDDIKARVREFLETEGHRVDGEVVMSNGRVCDLVTDGMVIECKAKLSLANWDKAVGQVDSYFWSKPTHARVLATSSVAPELELLVRQAIDNGYRIILADPATRKCEWMR